MHLDHVTSVGHSPWVLPLAVDNTKFPIGHAEGPPSLRVLFAVVEFLDLAVSDFIIYGCLGPLRVLTSGYSIAFGTCDSVIRLLRESQAVPNTRVVNWV